MAPGLEVVAEMRERGVRAAKMFPRRHGYRFDEEVCGEIFSALEAARVFRCSSTSAWGRRTGRRRSREVAEVCRRHPDLPVLLQKAKWNQTRDLLALLAAHAEHVRRVLDASGPLRSGVSSPSPWARTGSCSEPSGRSRAPARRVRSSTTATSRTRTRRRWRAGIWLGSWGWTRCRRSIPPAVDGPILTKAKAGQPLDHIPVIDPHTHVLHDGLMGGGYVAMPHGDAEHMIRRNRPLGVDQFCCSSWIGIWIDYRRGNELIHDLTQRYPDDIIGYATIDPKKSEDVAADIALCHDTYGFRGLKPYNPRVGLPYNSPLYDSWYAKGNEIGGFVKLHQTAIGDSFLDEIDDIATRYPNMNYLLAHSGWTWEVARERAEFARDRPNVYLDLTFTSVLHGVVEFFVEEGLADKVLYCTDAPMRDAIPQFGWVAYSRISEADKEKIFGGNMLRVLEHAGVPTEALRERYGLEAA